MMANGFGNVITSPSLLRGYMEIRPLGKGSYGSTTLMGDDKGNIVVRKRIDIELLSDVERNLCMNEIDIAAKIRHPFIVKYVGGYIEDNCLCIITEYCNGGDLHQYIARRRRLNKPIKESRILVWLTQILLALKFLHKRHTLHRDSDLKSLNILIDSSKNIRLCDFGVSKTLNKTSDFTGTIIGTPYYFSPEIINGCKYTWSSDIWALGCLIYELATFKTPFDGAKGMQQLCKLINEQPIPDLPPIYSRELNIIYKSMMFHDLRLRLSASELLATTKLQKVLRKMLVHATRNSDIIFSTDSTTDVSDDTLEDTNNSNATTKVRTINPPRSNYGKYERSRKGVQTNFNI